MRIRYGTTPEGKIVKISKKLYLIFQVTMLTKVFEIYDDEEAALQSFLNG